MKPYSKVIIEDDELIMLFPNQIQRDIFKKTIINILEVIMDAPLITEIL